MTYQLVWHNGLKFADCIPINGKPETINYKQNFVIMALEFTDTNFQEKVLDSDKLSVIDFWAEWCGPCRAIGPVIEELSKEYTGKVNVGKVNVDNNPQLSINYGVTSIPAILFVKGGQVVDKLVGAQPKANFVKKIEQHIG
ncbi:MAG TPA: thioredoxin [Agriterribacter sp.]|nr:thioredoxin [Agriterribacter sp.]